MNDHLTNTCDYDEAHLGEALRAQVWATQKLRTLILGAVALGILFYCLYAWLIRGETKYQFPVLLCVLMLCMLLYVILGLPSKTAKAQAARVREANGGSRFCFEFREADLLMRSPSGEEGTPVGYGDCTKVLQTRKLILLFTDAKAMLILDRAGFQHGTEADFWRLIREKCPSLSIKKK